MGRRELLLTVLPGFFIIRTVQCDPTHPAMHDALSLGHAALPYPTLLAPPLTAHGSRSANGRHATRSEHPSPLHPPFASLKAIDTLHSCTTAAVVHRRDPRRPTTPGGGLRLGLEVGTGRRGRVASSQRDWRVWMESGNGVWSCAVCRLCLVIRVRGGIRSRARHGREGTLRPPLHTPNVLSTATSITPLGTRPA